jgi:acyl-CoA synthetase (AMP-forming)/AMP-acid ligase II/thioesterase domain-containing protein
MEAATIAAMIATRAARDPSRVAVDAPGRAPLTYGALLATMTRIAATLRELGIGAHDRVALALPNGPEAAVAFLAVAGAATCAPLNPAYREDDFAFSFGDLRVKAVIAARDQVPAACAAAERAGLAVLEPRRRTDDPAGTFGLAGPACAPRVTADAGPRSGDVALVLHTSGTTARPKIVPLTQENLCFSADNIARTLELGSEDACLNVMPLFHIHGLMAALLATLAAGARVTCPDGFRATDFAARLREHGATWTTAVPTIHQAVLAACGERDALAGTRLRFVRSSSAALPARVLAELEERFAVPVIEAYGMTEASHQMASNPRSGPRKAGSVGPPAGPEIAVMGEDGRLLEGPGRVGEIVVRGPTLTRGYERNPDANAAAFTDGWFRTGDQGFVDEDGYVFLTGRLKELVNRGGEKIAPREVEDALLRHPAVAQAVAFAVPHARLGEEVGAAVVLRAGARASRADLQRAAAEHLPYFKVPRRIAVVDDIPKGATGKVQRATLAQALGMAAADGAAEDDACVAPRSPLDRELAALWSRVLGRGGIGLEDDFFALGGDSLAAVEMLEAAAELLNCDVPVADFLEHPTIACLTELRERAAALVRDAEVVPLRLAGSGWPIFCTALHDGNLWRAGRLLRFVSREHPIFGFPAPPVAARGAPPTIEEIAERHLAALARIQPEGPVHLVGPCFGGAVALEMAIRLEESGRPVALLVMVNTYNRAWRRVHRDATLGLRARHLVERVRFHAGRLRAQDASERSAYLRARGRLTVARWREEAERLAFRLATRAGVPRPRMLRKPAHANRLAQARYVARPYHGGVLMVRASAPIASVYPLPLMGWSEALRGPVEVLDVPCEQLEFWADDEVLRAVARRIEERVRGALRADVAAASELAAASAPHAARAS